MKEIIELTMLPGTMADKLKEARKRGIATTTAELISKVYGSTGSLIKTVGEVGEAVVEAKKAIVLARGASKATTEAVEKLEKLAGKCKQFKEIGKTIGKIASAAAVIADGFRLLTALNDRDFSAAGDALVDMAIDAAPLVAGESAGVALAGIVFLVKTEIAAISMAAEFIRYCKDEQVRQAAESFINECGAVAKSARQLVADCDVVIQASNPGVQDMALRKANREAADVSRAIRALSSHVTSKGKNVIGGYPKVVAALGKPALVPWRSPMAPTTAAFSRGATDRRCVPRRQGDGGLREGELHEPERASGGTRPPHRALPIAASAGGAT